MPLSDADKLNPTIKSIARELNRLGNILEAVNDNLVEVGRMMKEEWTRRETGIRETAPLPPPSSTPPANPDEGDVWIQD